MRSYYAHLSTTAPSKKTKKTPHPIFRSSGIFPALQQPGLSTRILFMGYWILKRHIQEIACVVTLRSDDGQLVGRQSITIKSAKTYRVELTDYISNKEAFEGTLEIEFFSSQHLVFPYPAIVVNYYGPTFSSVVHTAQRIYNDREDASTSSQTVVPESGFNIYADERHDPLIGLINGSLSQVTKPILFTCYNLHGEKLQHTFEPGPLAPYQLLLLRPADTLPLAQFLHGEPGACKLQFEVNNIFPRLVVGNFSHQPNGLVITHTYYDCTKATTDSDYWLPTEPDWFPASLMIPVSLEKSRFTNIYFYPIYSPSSFHIDVELYDAAGTLQGKKENALTIDSKGDQFSTIRLREICEELNIPTERPLGARIIARTQSGERIPARIKLGLDLGQNPKSLPCNICTNLQPFNPSLETKPRSFKWAPLLADQPQSSVWVMSSSPAVSYTKTAKMEVTFFREKDTETLKRTMEVPPHGFVRVSPETDPELKAFLEGHIGWVTVISSNPYTTTYYFAENPSGIVGGDHGF